MTARDSAILSGRHHRTGSLSYVDHKIEVGKLECEFEFRGHLNGDLYHEKGECEHGVHRKKTSRRDTSLTYTDRHSKCVFEGVKAWRRSQKLAF